ncbi:MAG: hypothetical protein IJX08_02000 [Clostridia bacterium]|nr:hypothetical protein [Clostridia bacterium]
MKRIVAVLMLTAMLLTALPLLAGAKQKDLWVDMDYEELWERKNEEEGEIENVGLVEYVIPLCPILGNDMTVLFYTDAFDEFTFERRVAEDYENGPSWEAPVDRQLRYLPSIGYTQYIYSEELNQILNERCVYATDYEYEDDQWGSYSYTVYDQHLPYLRGCIDALGITKEELRAACVRSRENPDYIREKLSMFTDEEFEKMKAQGELTCDYDQSYLLDALYLPDENEVRELCLLPYGVTVDGKIQQMWRLEYDDQYEIYGGKTLTEWMMSHKINTPGMKRMLKNANAVADFFDWPGEVNLFRKNIAALEARVAELDAMEEQAPKAGDRTVLYLLISAAGFAGGVVLLHEMKKRKN